MPKSSIFLSVINCFIDYFDPVFFIAAEAHRGGHLIKIQAPCCVYIEDVVTLIDVQNCIYFTKLVVVMRYSLILDILFSVLFVIFITVNVVRIFHVEVKLPIFNFDYHAKSCKQDS